MKQLLPLFLSLALFFTFTKATAFCSTRQAADYPATAGPARQYLLVLSKGEKSVIVLDYRTLERVASIPVGEDPHEIVTNPQGTLAYVSKPEMNGQGHQIAVLDLQSLRLKDTIDTRPFYIPHGLSWLNHQLWFTAQGSKTVAVYDTQEKKITQVFGTGQDFTHLIYVRPDGQAFYTTNVESGTVSIYELTDLPPYMPPTGVLPAGAKPRREWRQTLVKVDPGCEGFDVSGDGKELWTASPDGNLVVVDLDKKTVKAKINTHVAGLHRLKITPDGKTVCVVSVKTGDLLFYNRQSHRPEQTLHIGQGAGIYMDAASQRMFISCTPDNYVSVFDLRTRREIRKIKIGRPDGITSVTVQ